MLINKIKINLNNNLKDCLEEVAQSITNSWKQIQGIGDPNTSYDIIDLANNIKEICNINLFDVFINKNQIVEIVELIEKEFIHKSPHSSIRLLNANDLLYFLNKLYYIVREKLEQWNLKFETKEELLVKILYLWHGCINIDKVCRRKDATGMEIKDEHRLLVHTWLLEQGYTNIWIRKGFSAAEVFRQYQKNDKYNDWISKDSPYWKKIEDI